MQHYRATPSFISPPPTAEQCFGLTGNQRSPAQQVSTHQVCGGSWGYMGCTLPHGSGRREQKLMERSTSARGRGLESPPATKPFQSYGKPLVLPLKEAFGHFHIFPCLMFPQKNNPQLLGVLRTFRFREGPQQPARLQPPQSKGRQPLCAAG